MVSSAIRKTFREPAYERIVAKIRRTLETLASELFEPNVQVANNLSFDEFDKTFRQLVTEHHPDRGGKSEIMSALNQLRQALQVDTKQARSR